MTSDGIAGNGGAKGRPNFKYLHLSGLYSGRAVGAFVNLWYPSAEYSLTPRRRGEAVPASFQHPQRCSVQRSRGALLLPLPLHKSVPRLPPLFSLYQYFQRKKTFRATRQVFEDAATTVRWGFLRLFNQTIPFFLMLRV